MKKANLNAKKAAERARIAALVEKFGKYEELNVSNGNTKLVTDRKNRFIIWNLPAVITCPYATEHCKAKCYARKAERLYPDCFPSRMVNFGDSLKNDFVPRMVYTIAKRALWDIEHGRTTTIRIHESGDFYNTKYACKWFAIAEMFNDCKNVVFMFYTKSKPFTDIAEKKHNANRIVASFSVWDDSPEWFKTQVENEGRKVYTAYDRQTIDSMKNSGVKFHECRCSDCGSCRVCMTEKVKLTVCEIH